MPSVHVVSHTHWDREWYHPAERFRQRLVALIDELVEHPPAAGRSFLLDGQAVVLEDYLDVRPERASELGTLLRDGRLEAGPWYVLADELIPGGEGLVRNLLEGRRILRALRAEAPPVLYCPDSFGHASALPDLAEGFDKPLIVLWRGYRGARTGATNVVRWRSASGSTALVYHLTRSGYELGSSLPVDRDGAAQRWARISAEFGERQAVVPELLLNGADHHARQRSLNEALESLGEVAAPVTIVPGTLRGFSTAAIRAADSIALPEVTGELRDSYGHTWTLQGTLASRTPQKRRYALAERELVRDVEPWAALVVLRHGPSRRHLLRAAWKPLLLCQPHDTLCGCSTDQVARAMNHRLESVESQAAGLREDALLDVLGHDREAARRWPQDWQPVVLIRNRAPRRRSGVAIAAISMTLHDVPVGPGSAARQDVVTPRFDTADATVTFERTESPRAYPDNDAVVQFHTALWVQDAPAYGILPVPLTPEFGVLPPAHVAVEATRRSLSNGRLRVSWDARGRITVEDLRLRRKISNLLTWESRADVGDLYTPAIRGRALEPRLVGARVLEQGPLLGVLEQRWRLSRRREHVEVTLRLVLEAGASIVRFGVLGENAARDHRLRLVVKTDVSRPRVFADAAFATVERNAPRVPLRDARMEKPIATAPLHRYVSLFGGRRGATLYADGSTEYEAVGGDVAVTLLRAVGALSRNDLPERPGHAGWPADTPEAQCIGPFAAEFALLLHGGRSPAVVANIEETADDALYPLVGETLRSALSVPPPVEGIELTGRGLAFSCATESDDGNWIVLRCINLLDTAVQGTWRLPGRPLSEARLARLDETNLAPAAVSGDAVAFTANPRAVVTVLVR